MMEFERSEKYIIAKGDSMDSNRYVGITVDDKDVILVMDEDNKVMQVRMIDEEEISSNNIDAAKECAIGLITEAETASYTPTEEKYWKFYNDEIKSEYEIPELEKNMYGFQFIA